ncbi:hypothetical protein D3C74_378500 [compost metagenome]
MVTGLDTENPLNAPEVKLTVASLVMDAGDGRDCTLSKKRMVAPPPAPSVPTGIPFCGLAVTTGVPLIVTLPGTKAVPKGMVSVTITLVTGSSPLLNAVMT